MKTTDKSSADALTDEQILSIAEKHHASHPGVDEWWEFRYRADVVAFGRALLAAFPVEQSAAAPIPYDGLTEEFTDEVARLANDAPGIREAVSAALENCNAIIAPQGNAAPAPADERTAFEAWRDKRAFNLPSYGGLAEAYAWDAWQTRASSPNAAGAGPVAQWQSRLKDRSSPVVDHWVNISPDGAKTLMEKYANVYEVRALYAAPQPPAQANAREGLTDAVEQLNGLLDACENGSKAERVEARSAIHAFYRRALLAAHPGQPVADEEASAPVGLTDEQREAIEYAARWLEENVSNRYAYTAVKQLRTLLAARAGEAS